MTCRVLALLLVIAYLSPRTATADTVTFPTFGVSMTPPEGTSFRIVRGANELGVYEFTKASPYFGAAIQIEVRQAKGASLADLAASLAKTKRAQVSDEQITIGGEKAIKLLESAPDPVGNATDCLVIHDKLFYIFRARSRQGMNIEKPFKEFLPTVKFIPLESPVPHLQEMTKIPFNGLGLFTIPAPSCTRASSDGEGQLFMDVRDMRVEAPVFVVNIQLIQTPPNNTFAQIRPAYAKGLEAQFHLTEQMQFHDQPGVPGLNVSQAVKCTLMTPKGKEEPLNRFCILDLGGGKFVQILFTISAADPADAKAYVELSDRMLAGIKIAPPKPTTKPAAQPATKP